MSLTTPFQLNERTVEETIARRVILGTRGYDTDFLKKSAEIFEINAWLDGEDGRLLRNWVTVATADIVSLFCITPSVLMGTINAGVDVRQYVDLTKRGTPEQLEDFDIAYKEYAIKLIHHLSESLERYVNKAIEQGFDDISCTVIRHRIGMILVMITGVKDN